jgi:hypothetical protein
MVVLLNLLPNIYWVYRSPANLISEGEYNIEVHKIKELYGIRTYVELDQTLEFWGKSRQYLNEIKMEIEKNEFRKLLVIYKKLEDAIKKAYLGNTPLLISTYKKDILDVGLGIWIYFFHINAALTFDGVIKLLGLKVIGELSLSESLSKFFAFLNMSNR